MLFSCRQEALLSAPRLSLTASLPWNGCTWPSLYIKQQAPTVGVTITAAARGTIRCLYMSKQGRVDNVAASVTATGAV